MRLARRPSCKWLLQKTIADFVVQPAKFAFDVSVLLALPRPDAVDAMRLAFQRNLEAPEFLMGLPRDTLHSRWQIQQVT